MQNHLMFVCAMNVCRSPLLAATFHNSLIASVRSDWSVLSRGTHAAPNAGICKVAASLVECTDRLHSATPVVAEQLRGSDLILTATMTERAILARMAPALRERTFTLREAIMLARLDEMPSWTPGPDVVVPARRFAALLNARRGLVTPEEPRSRRSRRKGINPLDVPDVHLLKPRAHLAGLRAAQQDAGEIARHVSAFSISP